MAGAGDLIIPIQEAEAMAQAIPNAQLHLIANAGHLASLENPAEVNARMRDFLSSLV
jgi:pimeloyl-ACP methyl ester carboxylesterase